MTTLLTTPIDVPAQQITVQRIDGLYINYTDESLGVTIGNYADDTAAEAISTESHTLLMSDIPGGAGVAYFEKLLSSVRLLARISGYLKPGVDS